MRSLIFFLLILLFSISFSQEKRPKVGLVLSGGGAKGYAHIGVLKVLEEEGVKIDYIGGTSMGAIIGGLYAAGYSANELEEIVESLDLNQLLTADKTRADLPLFEKSYKEKYMLELPFNDFKLSIPSAVSTGQSSLEVLTFLLRYVHDVNDFNKLPIPFLCVGTNIVTGEEKIFRSGFLPKVIMASGAFPTLIEPIDVDGELYVDGGIKNNYPVQEVKDMGADIIIGVDLQRGLLTKEELQAGTKVIEQIIGFNIVDRTKEQSKSVDITIKPKLEKYSVTDFSEKDSIVLAGKVAAKAMVDDLKKLAAQQGVTPRLSMPKKETPKYTLITNVNITGLSTYSESYIKGKVGIRPPHLISYEDIKKGIKTLYSSGNFNKVYYSIKNGNDGHKQLNIDLKENPNKQTLRFGLHYDDLYKTGLLVNYTARHLGFNNSILSADFVLGDFPRYSLNFYIDNGIYPSFGVNSSFKQFDTNVKINEDLGSIGFVEEVGYQFNELTNQLYTQSTVAEKYALGGGVEHQYIDIYSNSFNFLDLEKSYYLNLYGFIKADNRNNPNFPSKGFKLDGTFKFFLDSNSNDFEKTSQLNVDLEYNLPISKSFSYRFFGSFGTYLGLTTTFAQSYTLGGYVNQPFLNHSKFYGLPFAFDGGNSKIILGSTVQLKIHKNHYFSGILNIANVEEDFEDIQFTRYKHVGYALSYGYDSPLGPISAYWAYSPSNRSGLFNISLGYWF